MPRKGLEPSCLSALAPKASASTNFATWARMNTDYTLNHDIVRAMDTEKFAPKIIHEDEQVIVINKPFGMVVHPFDYSTEYTLVDFFLEKYPEIFSIENKIKLQDGRTIELGGIVHKLDRDTSGIMVIAKTQKIFNELQTQFKNHTIKKKYIALVEGIIEKENFTIDAPLGRSKKDYKQSTNPINPRGELRSAITKVKILQRNNQPHRQDLWVTLVELSPLTGRTHQLRAHMSSIGHPIVGDIAYGSKISLPREVSLRNVESPRIMLHAEKISFTLENKNYSFETPIPEDFN